VHSSLVLFALAASKECAILERVNMTVLVWWCTPQTFSDFDDALMRRLLEPGSVTDSYKRAALAGSCALMACIDGADVFLVRVLRLGLRQIQ
jgi:hypothetical protein